MTMSYLLDLNNQEYIIYVGNSSCNRVQPKILTLGVGKGMKAKVSCVGVWQHAPSGNFENFGLDVLSFN